MKSIDRVLFAVSVLMISLGMLCIALGSYARAILADEADIVGSAIRLLGVLFWNGVLIAIAGILGVFVSRMQKNSKYLNRCNIVYSSILLLVLLVGLPFYVLNANTWMKCSKDRETTDRNHEEPFQRMCHLFTNEQSRRATVAYVAVSACVAVTCSALLVVLVLSLTYEYASYKTKSPLITERLGGGNEKVSYEKWYSGNGRIANV